MKINPQWLNRKMAQDGTTSIVWDRMTTSEVSRSQSMPSAVNPGQRVTERAKKSLYSHGDQEHGERLKVSEVAVAKWMLVSENAQTFLGVPPWPIGEMRTKGVSEPRLTVTFWRHNRRQYGSPLNLSLSTSSAKMLSKPHGIPNNYKSLLNNVVTDNLG